MVFAGVGLRKISNKISKDEVAKKSGKKLHCTRCMPPQGTMGKGGGSKKGNLERCRRCYHVYFFFFVGTMCIFLVVMHAEKGVGGANCSGFGFPLICVATGGQISISKRMLKEKVFKRCQCIIYSIRSIRLEIV